jgi:general secretion pathway protein A
MLGVLLNRGFTALIAYPGMGKTSLLFDLLEKIHISTRTVFLFQPQLTPQELMRSLLADLGIPDAGGRVADMTLKLNEVLLRETASGKKVVIVIDEAQALSEEVLEVLRMLSNFETSREKLVHIVLAGQPELADRLASSSMIQFRQRISIVARLNPFDAAETRAYIEHRLQVAGHKGWRPIFTDHAYALIAKHSQGIPRNINNLCFNAMSLGCAMGQRSIGHSTVYEVLRDLDLRPCAVETAEQTDDLAIPSQMQSSWHLFGTFRRRLVAYALFAIVAGILCWPLPLAKIHSIGTAADADSAAATSKVVALPAQADSHELNSSAQVQQPKKTKAKLRPASKRDPQ